MLIEIILPLFFYNNYTQYISNYSNSKYIISDFIKCSLDVYTIFKKTNKNISFEDFLASIIDNVIIMIDENKQFFDLYYILILNELTNYFNTDSSKSNVFDLEKIKTIKSTLFTKIKNHTDKDNNKLTLTKFIINHEFTNRIPNYQELKKNYTKMIKKIEKKILYKDLNS